MKHALLIAVAACKFAPGAGDPDARGTADAAADVVVIDTPDAAPVTSCPAGYTSLGTLTAKYRVVTATEMWPDAEAACEADGAAHLVVLTDQAEAVAVADATGALTWTGIDNRLDVNVWRSVTGEPPFLPWIPGQPTGDVNKRCAVVHDDPTKKGLIEPKACTEKHAYVCECDFRRADPTSF